MPRPAPNPLGAHVNASCSTGTPPATRTSRGPGSPCGAPSWPPYSTSRHTSPVTAVEVHGAADSPSTVLLAAWLQLQLKVPVTLGSFEQVPRFQRHPGRASAP